MLLRRLLGAFFQLAILVPISQASAAQIFFDPGKSTAVPPGGNYIQAGGSTSFQNYLNGLNGERGVVVAYSAGGSYLADQVTACKQYAGGCRFVLVDANNNNGALDPVLQYYKENPQGLKVLCTSGYDSPFCKNSDFAAKRTSCSGTHDNALNNCNIRDNIGLSTPCPPPTVLITSATRAEATAAGIPGTSSCWDPNNPNTGKAAGDAKIYLQKHAEPGVSMSCLNGDFAVRLAKLMQSVPKPPTITEAWRSPKAQNSAQASGASKVSSCESWHNYGLAADFNKKGEEELANTLRKNSPKFGLTTIRDAPVETGRAIDTGFTDPGHIQMAGPLPPRDQCMQSCGGTGGAASTRSATSLAPLTVPDKTQTLATIDPQTGAGQSEMQRLFGGMNISPSDSEKIVNQDPQRALDLLNAMKKGDEPAAQSIAKDFNISSDVIKSNMGTIESAAAFPAASPSASAKSAAPPSPIAAPAVASQSSARGPYITSGNSPDYSGSGNTWLGRNWAYVAGGAALVGVGAYFLSTWTNSDAPSATLTAQPMNVHRGDTVSVSWSSKETTSCVVAQNNVALGYGTVGSAYVPTSSTTPSTITILLQCTGKSDNQPVQKTAVVSVQ